MSLKNSKLRGQVESRRKTFGRRSAANSHYIQTTTSRRIFNKSHVQRTDPPLPACRKWSRAITRGIFLGPTSLRSRAIFGLKERRASSAPRSETLHRDYPRRALALKNNAYVRTSCWKVTPGEKLPSARTIGANYRDTVKTPFIRTARACSSRRERRARGTCVNSAMGVLLPSFLVRICVCVWVPDHTLMKMQIVSQMTNAYIARRLKFRIERNNVVPLMIPSYDRP